MANDPFYHQCCLRSAFCSGRIEWHHVWTYAGKQINEVWAIVPACQKHHRLVGRYKNDFQRISLNRATKEDLDRYPRVDWKQLKKKLGL